MNDKKPFNPDMLVVARESRGFTQSRLATEAKLSQGIISKWENRLAEPSEAALETLGDALGVPVGFFFQSDPVYGLPPTFFRRKQAVGKKLLGHLHAEMTLIRLHLIRLLRSVDLEPSLPFPEYDVEEYGSPEEVARYVRAGWLVRSGPIPDLVDLVEKAGVLIIPLNLQAEGVDAVGWRVPDLPPLIFVNTSAPTDRLRFTIAHELGHLVMHRIPTKDMEEEANRFAAEFLAPAGEIRADLSGITLDKLALLKMVWRISMAALLFRAHELEKLSTHQYRYLWTQFGKRGWRKREPASTDLSPENPRLLDHIFDTHLRELEYSPAQLAEALNCFPDDLTRLYSVGTPSLKVVS